MPPTVPDDARLRELAEAHESEAKGLQVDLDATAPGHARTSIKRVFAEHRDLAAACRAVIAARAWCDKLLAGEEVSFGDLHSILGARGGNDG